MNRQEAITAHFYWWELRGRGWDVWDEPIDLEPPFIPFLGHAPLFETKKRIDDGWRLPIIGHLVEAFKELRDYFETEEYRIPEQPLPYIREYETFVEYSVRLPRNWKDGGKMMRLINILSSSTDPVSFELISNGESIHIHIATPESKAQWLYSQLYIIFPSVVIHEAHPRLEELYRDESWVLCTDFGLE